MDQVHIGAKVPGRNVDDVVALLAQRARHSPVAVGRDVQQDRADAEILNLGNDGGEVLLAAHDDHIADCPIPGQGGQVLANLRLDALLPVRASLAEAEFHARHVGEGIMFGRTVAIRGTVIPVTAQQRQPCAVPGQAAEELEQACVVPGNRVTIASAMNGERTIY